MTTAANPIRAKRVLPGLTLSLGTTLLYLTLIVLIPVIALILKGAEIGPARFTPGTKMPEQTVTAAEDRAALVRFLEQATR